MKREVIQRAVQEVVLDVFEDMYFMFPEAIAEDDPVPSFSGPHFKAGIAVKNASQVLML